VTRLTLSALLALGLLGTPAHAAGKKVTLDSLLRQMTDLSLLAEYPDPPYVTKQFSSYDRASETPKDAGGWFANADRGFTLYDGTVTRKTLFFKTSPGQGRAPDGHFAAGTKVGIAPTHKPVGEYVWAYATAPDGRPVGGNIPQGYVAKSAIRMDPEGHVLAEMDGPGCVVRIWSANPADAGNVRVYLDGAKEPVISAPLDALLGGKWHTETAGKKWTPFPDPIACERSRGFNLYFPIAYAKHCKITVDKPDIYFHVDYRVYPKGTEVETLSLPSLLRVQEQLTRVREHLSWATTGKAKKPVLTIPLRESKGIGKVVEPGKQLQLAFKGPGAVKLFQGSVAAFLRNAQTFHEAEALRGLVLVATFDGAATPQIWCPLGDFFASSPGVNEYKSQPFWVGKIESSKQTPKEVKFWAWWSMPFEKSAVFEVRNLGKQSANVHLFGMNTPYQWTDRSMHFHAKWRTQTMNTRPFRDWNYCDLKGKGVFVGDMLSVMNPVTAWWGEGDEKIYVDGEKFPSWFGTGTEDYYGYAWCDPKPFRHAYHSQTRCDGPANKGLTSVNRFHILDAIPFTKSFRFDMEVWHWIPNIKVTYAATSYWYARPGATDDFHPVEAKVLQDVPSPPPPYQIKGALEGEKLRILKKSGDFGAGPQDMAPFTDDKNQWSGDSHLWVRPPNKGSLVDLELPVKADGRYRVTVYLTKARDYGIIRFRLNGKPLGKAIDCFEANRVVATGPVRLGTAELKKGTAKLRVEVISTNPKSDGLRYMWGLDCVRLTRVAATR
jgi:hypothetical protein